MFYRKRSIVFEIIKQRIELLKLIEDSKNKYMEIMR